MYYAPHYIRYSRPEGIARDEFNRPVKTGHIWQEGGDCRCDDSSEQQLFDESGRAYNSKHKVVISGYTSIKAGDQVEVYWKESNELRGKGRVAQVQHTNYLPYSVIWV